MTQSFRTRTITITAGSGPSLTGKVVSFQNALAAKHLAFETFPANLEVHKTTRMLVQTLDVSVINEENETTLAEILNELKLIEP